MESFSYCSAASKSLLWHKTPLLCTSVHQALPASVSILHPTLIAHPFSCGPREFCLTIFFSLDCHHPAGLQNPQRPIQGLPSGFLFHPQLSCSLTKHHSCDHSLSLCLVSLLSLWIFILTTGTAPPQHHRGSLFFDPYRAASSTIPSVLWTRQPSPWGGYLYFPWPLLHMPDKPQRWMNAIVAVFMPTFGLLIAKS